MAKFSYIVVNNSGEEVRGSMEAPAAENVMTRLRNEGFVIVSVKKESILTKEITFGLNKKVKHRDLSVFCRQFSAILGAGVPVVEALTILFHQTENPTLRDALGKTAENVKQGVSLADSLAKYPTIFPEMFVNMVDAGEISGTLDVCVDRMGTQFEKDAKLSGLIKKAMIYPIAIFSVAIVVIIVMSIVAVPKFADIFSMMGADLPWATKAIMKISDLVLHKWYLLIAVCLSLALIFRYIAKSDEGKEFFGRLALKLPLFGKLNTKTYSAKFARTMSTLVASGMGLTFSLDVAARTLKNVKFKQALMHAKEEVEQGINLSKPLRECGLFPAMICSMLAVGEETGNVEGMLDKCADYYEEEAEIETGLLTEAMQPLIIVVMGLIIGVMVLALYQPMISVYSAIGGL